MATLQTLSNPVNFTHIVKHENSYINKINVTNFESSTFRFILQNHGKVWLNMQSTTNTDCRLFCDIDIDESQPDSFRKLIVREYSKFFSILNEDYHKTVQVSKKGKIHIITNIRVPNSYEVNGTTINRNLIMKAIHFCVQDRLTKLIPGFDREIIDPALYLRAPFCVKYKNNGFVDDWYCPRDILPRGSWKNTKPFAEVDVPTAIDYMAEWDLSNMKNTVELDFSQIIEKLKILIDQRNLEDLSSGVSCCGLDFDITRDFVVRCISLYPSHLLSNFYRWKSFMMAVKHAQTYFPDVDLYEIADNVCKEASGYNQQQNQELYDQLPPASFVKNILKVVAMKKLLAKKPKKVAPTLDLDVETLDEIQIDDELNQKYLDPKIFYKLNKKQSLVIKSGTGTGKTYALREYLRLRTQRLKNEKMVLVTYRRSLANEFYTKMKSLGFKNYQHLTGKIKAEKIIIQVESLARLDFGYYDDNTILILDESESIFSQLNSKFIKNTQYTKEMVKHLMKSKRVIAMDALAGFKTWFLLDLYGRRQHWIVNRYQSKQTTRYGFMSNYTEFSLKIATKLSEGKRLFIPTNSKKRALEFHKICEGLKKNALLITGDSHNEKEREYITNNIDKYLNENSIDVFICTSSVESGISIEQWVPDYVMAHFTANSCDHQSCYQMLDRCRSVSSGEVLINFTTVSKYEAELTIHDVYNELQCCESALHRCATKLGIPWHYDNGFIFAKGPYLRIFTYSKVFEAHSMANFAEKLVQCIKMYCPRANLDTIGLDSVECAIMASGKFDKKMTKVKQEVRKESNDKIVNADLADDTPAAETKKIMMSVYEVTESEIDNDFVEKYSKFQTITSFNRRKKAVLMGMDQYLQYENLKEVQSESVNHKKVRYAHIQVANDILDNFSTLSSTKLLQKPEVFQMDRKRLFGQLKKIYNENPDLLKSVNALFHRKSRRIQSVDKCSLKKLLSFTNAALEPVFGVTISATNKHHSTFVMNAGVTSALNDRISQRLAMEQSRESLGL
jgi:hypothetical protein